MSDATTSLADQLEVRTLIARLSHVTDLGTVEEYLACFTDDASLQIADTPPRAGRAALEEGANQGRASGRLGPGSNSAHVTVTIAVDVDGDEASSLSRFVFLSDTTGTPTIVITGVYTDRFRRTADGWRLAERHMQPC